MVLLFGFTSGIKRDRNLANFQKNPAVWRTGGTQTELSEPYSNPIRTLLSSTSDANVYHQVRERVIPAGHMKEACKKIEIGKTKFTERRFIVELMKIDPLPGSEKS